MRIKQYLLSWPVEISEQVRHFGEMHNPKMTTGETVCYILEDWFKQRKATKPDKPREGEPT